MKEYNPVVAFFTSLFMGMSGTDRVYFGDYGYASVKASLFLALLIATLWGVSGLSGFSVKFEFVQFLGLLVVGWWLVDLISVFTGIAQNGASTLFGKEVVFFDKNLVD